MYRDKHAQHAHSKSNATFADITDTHDPIVQIYDATNVIDATTTLQSMQDFQTVSGDANDATDKTVFLRQTKRPTNDIYNLHTKPLQTYY